VMIGRPVVRGPTKAAAREFAAGRTSSSCEGGIEMRGPVWAWLAPAVARMAAAKLRFAEFGAAMRKGSVDNNKSTVRQGPTGSNYYMAIGVRLNVLQTGAACQMRVNFCVYHSL
jgi:hypothetical protein